ncbi:CHAT domain-containing protein [Granulicella aggregans]|uniref:CHAT domain-containing protein n=2 Tax=Granulicella aggregans TaxID=474949 RepID=A0A7W7Z8Y5_9BACT|nr:CHAT domain-containing protein [Granulicella aggregans]
MMSGFAQAISAYHRALVLSGDAKPVRCAALTRLAWTEANIGSGADSLRDAADAVQECVHLKDDDAPAYARAVEAEGEAQFWSGQVGKATASLTRARELAAGAGDMEIEALSAMMLAYNVHPDDPVAARRLLASSMELWSRNGNRYGTARAELVAAYFAGREGDYAAAECAARSALALFERIADSDNAAIAYNNLGMVARNFGDEDAAIVAYTRARRLFAAAGDELGEGDAISGLMELSVASNYLRSAGPELYARGRAIAKATNGKALLATALVGTGDIDLSKGRARAARDTYRKSLDAAREARNPLEIALALGRLARAAVAMGDLEEALNLHAQALIQEQQAGATEDVARTHYLRSRIYLARGDPRRALSEIKTTISAIESQRLRIAKFESRAQYFAWVHEYYALYTRILMTLRRSESAEEFARLALESSERSKVRAFIDELVRTPQDASCSVFHKEADQPELAPALTGADPLSAPANPVASSLTAEQIQAEMKKSGAALVEFALGEERSFAWFVDGSRIAAVELPNSAWIQTRVERLRRALEPPESLGGETPEGFLERHKTQRRVAQELSVQLGKVLFADMPRLKGKELIIVPDGALQYLPFGALATADGTKLVEQNDITILPSVSALMALRKSTASRPEPQNKVVVIADPLYELPGINGKSSPNAIASRTILRSRELTRALTDLHLPGTIPSLPGSRLEASSIQKIIGVSGTRLVLGAEASRNTVLGGAFAQARVVHFATHGLLDARRPENSGLVLAMFNAQGKPQDGYLRMGDIHSLHLSAELVVLSSCESALGKDMGSEGIVGLPRAFLYAGAQRVIASLWKVDDEASAILMAYFYRELKDGRSPAAALNRAQLRMARNQKFHDPYFWAAFFIEGEFQ